MNYSQADWKLVLADLLDLLKEFLLLVVISDTPLSKSILLGSNVVVNWTDHR